MKNRKNTKERNTKKCPQCKLNFPSYMFDFPIYANGIYYYVCPICSLGIKNKVHGTNDTQFQGQIANQLLEDAREFVRGKQCQN